MTNWYYKKNPLTTTRFGPLTDEALKNAYMAGKIDMHTLIRNDNMAKWVELSDFKPLYDVFSKLEGRVQIEEIPTAYDIYCKKMKQYPMDPKVSKLEEGIQHRIDLGAEQWPNSEALKLIKELQRYEDRDAECSIVKVLLSFGFNHIDPIKFEELILRVFKSLGFKGSLTPPSGDDGIDILLTDKREKRVIIQCKRYNDNQTISPKDVREFLGSMTHAKAEYAFFVTTSSFSENAKEFCKDKSIYLVDGEKLKRLFLFAIRADFHHTYLGDEYFENQQNFIKYAFSLDSGNDINRKS